MSMIKTIAIAGLAMIVGIFVFNKVRPLVGK